jgi:hypothetical protein
MNPARLTLARLFAFALFIPAAALADGQGPPTPPKEAFDACSGAKSGDACTVKLGSHEIAGTCDEFPGGGGLACRPNGPPPPRE